MKYILLNLKRFDIPVKYGGVNRLASIEAWAKNIVENTQQGLARYDSAEVEFIQFFPEAHLMSAKVALSQNSPVRLGCQGVYREDTAIDGNFGAFTSNRPAAAAKALGCEAALIGHCEERNDIGGILAEAGADNAQAVNRLLNKEIKAAQNRGLKVVYCIGEKSEEQESWRQVLGMQLDIGLNGVNKDNVVIAYEPVWSIGPGKTPADQAYIEKIAGFVKEHTGGMPVVYGGGLKSENAEMLASISDIDGGLIALTRFSGDIGFYPEEYLEIIGKYLGTLSGENL